MKSILIKAIPHAVAVVLFLVLASNFLSLVDKGYDLKQGDIKNVLGMSKEFMDYRLVNNDEALWSNSMFGGMPGYQTNLAYPSNLLRPIDSFLKLYTTPSIGSFFMCMLGFYFMMLCLRVNPWLAIAAAVGFGFSTINILYLASGHVSKVNAIAYMAPVLGALILTFRGKWLLGSTLFALFFGLHISGNHYQMTYYLAFLLVVVAIFEAVKLIIQKQLGYLIKVVGALLVATVLGILPNMGALLTTYEYGKYTTRGNTELTVAPEGKEDQLKATDGLRDDYILEYNMAAGEPWSMVIPNAKGGPSFNRITDNAKAMAKVPASLKKNMGNFGQYWGSQGSSAGAFYFGAGIMFLFAFALMFTKDILRWPFLIISILSIMLCMREMHGMNDFFIHHMPYYNKFRDSKMILVLIQIMAPALGFMYLDSLLKKQLPVSARKWAIGGCAALVAVVLIVMASPSLTGNLITAQEETYFNEAREQYKSDSRTLTVVNDLQSSLSDARKVVFVEDAQRSLFIILAFAAVVILVVFGKIKSYLVASISVVIITVDLWMVNARYVNEERETNAEGKMDYKHYEKLDDRFLPYDPDNCDLAILNAEKAGIPEYDTKVAQLEKIMVDKKPWSELKNKKRIHSVAEFGVLNLNTDFRVMRPGSSIFSESGTAYFHKSLGGYHGAKLKRYQEMIDFYLSNEMNAVTQAFGSGNLASIDSALKTCNVVNMLNTRYIKYSPEAPPISNAANALGNAWFVNDLKMVANADEEILALKVINPATTAVVHNEFAELVKTPTTTDSTSSIVLTEYATKRLKYATHNGVEAPAIFSEIYYPAGWICRIDGQEVKSFRANYFLRAVMVPAGDHTVEWSFEPATYSKSIAVNWAGSFTLLLLVISVLAWNFREALKPQVVNEAA